MHALVAESCSGKPPIITVILPRNHRQQWARDSRRGDAMTETRVRPETGPRLLAVDETNLWVKRRGDGPDVLLIAA